MPDPDSGHTLSLLCHGRRFAEIESNTVHLLTFGWSFESWKEVLLLLWKAVRLWWRYSKFVLFFVWSCFKESLMLRKVTQKHSGIVWDGVIIDLVIFWFGLDVQFPTKPFHNGSCGIFVSPRIQRFESEVFKHRVYLWVITMKLFDPLMQYHRSFLVFHQTKP